MQTATRPAGGAFAAAADLTATGSDARDAAGRDVRGWHDDSGLDARVRRQRPRPRVDARAGRCVSARRSRSLPRARTPRTRPSRWPRTATRRRSGTAPMASARWSRRRSPPTPRSLAALPLISGTPALGLRARRATAGAGSAPTSVESRWVRGGAEVATGTSLHRRRRRPGHGPRLPCESHECPGQHGAVQRTVQHPAARAAAPPVGALVPVRACDRATQGPGRAESDGADQRAAHPPPVPLRRHA